MVISQILVPLKAVLSPRCSIQMNAEFTLPPLTLLLRFADDTPLPGQINNKNEIIYRYEVSKSFQGCNTNYLLLSVNLIRPSKIWLLILGKRLLKSFLYKSTIRLLSKFLHTSILELPLMRIYIKATT